MTIEGAVYISMFSLFIVSAFLWFLFSYRVVPRIDRRMAEAGQPKACPLDIMGLRVLMIATAIGLPVGNPLNHDGNPLISARAIRPYANSTEKLLGLMLTLTSYGWVLIALVGSFFTPEA
tara:strand:- start:737 stop:1096 length:360 start_codon:yes stop_codon:yes gene_type:complete